MSVPNVDAQLEVFPESVIEFLLPINTGAITSPSGEEKNGSAEDATSSAAAAAAAPKATMTLTHPDPKSPPIAFKVKTTQPRRYLVRPNQGLLLPGQSEVIQILLVEKEKSLLVQSYLKLGSVAFDHTKDKFLVQSIAILDNEQVSKLNDYEQLSTMWTTVGTSGSSNTSGIANKKLSVKFTVVDPSVSTIPSPLSNKSLTTTGSSASTIVQSNTTTPATNVTPTATDLAKMTSPQIQSEYTSLRRKYDELVAFSVNLTAERDILNNTLEQTKRDLNRQIAKVAANDNNTTNNTNSNNNATNNTSDKNRRNAANGTKRTANGIEKGNKNGFGIITIVVQIIIYVTLLLFGAQLQQSGTIEKHVPFISTTILPTLSYIVPGSLSSSSQSGLVLTDEENSSGRSNKKVKVESEADDVEYNSHRSDEL